MTFDQINLGNEIELKHVIHFTTFFYVTANVLITLNYLYLGKLLLFFFR